ncbi:DUF2690 domain-containing protein [Streptosporangium sp. NPDC002524]|uniref:DUF2690 domain-containing protein n=1 Tax=Streptosporangium sp. NPDC002524 TaxID=3154537 RepID=UPI00332D7A71
MFKKAIVLAMVIALLSALAPAASAKTTGLLCRGTQCNGVDPQTSGCGNDARTLETVEDTGGWVILELRYSPTCYAVWARVNNFRGVSGVAKIIGYSGGQFMSEQLKTLAAYPNESAYTKMISFTYTTYACYRKFHDLFGWTEWCSGGHQP